MTKLQSFSAAGKAVGVFRLMFCQLLTGKRGFWSPDSHPSNCIKQRKDGGLLCPSPALGKPCWLQVGCSVRGHSLKVWGLAGLASPL